MQSAIGIGPLLQSVEFDAILPHGLHFHPAPSHTAPTYPLKSYHNPVDVDQSRGLLIDCKYNAILTRSRRIAAKCSKLVQDWPKSQPDWSQPKLDLGETSVQNPGNAGKGFCNRLGIAVDSVLWHRIATKTSGEQS